MQEYKKNKGIWIALAMFILTFLADVTWVTWTVAQTSSKDDIAVTNWTSMNDFRIETVKGLATQKEINKELIRQLDVLSRKDSVIEYRVDRLDKAHKYPDPKWDRIVVPS
jgi:hypothetical protein